MLRLPRLLPSRTASWLAIASVFSIPLVSGNAAMGQADTAPAPAATAPAADTGATPAPAPVAAAPAVQLPEDESLKSSIENFWHYGKIARYDVAAAEGQRIVSQNTEPRELLAAFEAVAQSHHDN